MSFRWLPNAISLLRIVLIAPILLFVLLGDYALALVLFVIAGGSDGIDGYLAVRFNWQTRLGALLDPVADKLLVTGLFITLAVMQLIPVWLAVIVIARDVIIFSGAVVYNYLIKPVEGEPTQIGRALVHEPALAEELTTEVLPSAKIRNGAVVSPARLNPSL